MKRFQRTHFELKECHSRKVMGLKKCAEAVLDIQCCRKKTSGRACFFYWLFIENLEFLFPTELAEITNFSGEKEALRSFRIKYGHFFCAWLVQI